MPKPKQLNAAIDAYMAIVANRISEATAHAETIVEHRRRGRSGVAFTAALEIEPLIREANCALQAASLFYRERPKR